MHLLSPVIVCLQEITLKKQKTLIQHKKKTRVSFRQMLAYMQGFMQDKTIASHIFGGHMDVNSYT